MWWSTPCLSLRWGRPERPSARCWLSWRCWWCRLSPWAGKSSPLWPGLPYLKTGVALAAAVASVWWLLGSSLHPLVVLVASAVLFFAVYGVLLLLMGECMVREIWSQVWEKTVGKVLKK